MSPVSWQVPQAAHGWLLAGALVALLPLFLTPLPGWMAVLAPGCALWRWQVHRGRWREPGTLARTLLVLGVTLAVWRSQGSLLGPEGGTTLLAGAFCLKLLEMRRRRDAYVVLILGCFVVAAGFLFHQGPWMALLALLALWLLTAAMPGLNRQDSAARAGPQGRVAAVILLQALPLMLVLFVLVPRVAPLWGLPQQALARTGLSDRVAPGDVARLLQSAEVAFRLEVLPGTVLPPPAERYWRGLVYSQFDGRTWSQSPRDRQTLWTPGQGGTLPSWVQTRQQRFDQAENGTVARFRFMVEAHGQHWLFAPGVAISADQDLLWHEDGRLQSRRPLEQALHYTVQSLPLGMEDGAPDPASLQLPAGSNPRARELAARLRAEHGQGAELVAALLRHFREQPFHYRLTVPLLGRHSVDEFLFDRQEGYCEHYASATAFLLRAAGIPARLVGGYQGGALNPLGRHLTVRQYHAHAWVEAWLPEQGWVRLDPTAAVAPERVEMGPEALGESASLPLTVQMEQRMAWLRSLRDRMEHWEYRWRKWVMDYDQEAQQQLLGDGWRRMGTLGWGATLLGAVLLPLLMMALWWRWRERRRSSPWQRQTEALVRALRRRGWFLPPQPTVRQLAGVLEQALPGQVDQILAWRETLERQLYGPAVPERDGLALGRALLRRLRRGAVWPGATGPGRDRAGDG